jgi:hypothetical protein
MIVIPAKVIFTNPVFGIIFTNLPDADGDPSFYIPNSTSFPS